MSTKPPLQTRMNKALIWLVDTEFRSQDARRLANKCVDEYKEQIEAAKRLKEATK